MRLEGFVNNLQPDIDAVFTWVDGSDPSHIEKRRCYTNDLERPGTLAIAAISTRFQQSGELWYSVRLARKHAPWLRKIHIVTDSQTPSWLTEDIGRDLDINLVDHKEIFRGFEEYLPTFNSRTIEAMIHRIPGLSEQFIYLNDDFFMIKPVEPEDYFLDGKPLVRGRWTWKNRYLAYLERQARKITGRGKGLSGLVGKRPESDQLGRGRYFRLAHAPYAVKLSAYSSFFSNEDLLRSVIQYRFRNEHQIWPIGYFVNRALREGLAMEYLTDWDYLDSGLTYSDLGGLLKRVIEDSTIKHLCVQSLERFPRSDREKLLEFLSNLGTLNLQG